MSCSDFKCRSKNLRESIRLRERTAESDIFRLAEVLGDRSDETGWEISSEAEEDEAGFRA